MLDAMLRAAGYRTGLYTSPHLMRYNERVRLDGREASDDALVAGAQRSSRTRAPPATRRCRSPISSSARSRRSCCSREHAPDALVLEVGPRRPARRGQRRRRGRRRRHERRSRPPRLARRHARGHRAREGGHLPRRPRRRLRRRRSAALARRRGRAHRRDGSSSRDATSARSPKARSGATAGPAASATGCRIRRCAAATSSTTPRARSRRSTRCATALPVGANAMRDGLVGVELAGRFQVLPGRPTRVLDVAHNPHAARALARMPRRRWATTARRTRCSGCSPTRTSTASSRRCAGASTAGTSRRCPGRAARRPRSARGGARRARACPPSASASARDVAQRLAAARDEAHEADRIVAFGSFLTVAAALAAER